MGPEANGLSFVLGRMSFTMERMPTRRIAKISVPVIWKRSDHALVLTIHTPTLRIHDSLGNLVHEVSGVSSMSSISLRAAPGVYIIHLELGHTVYRTRYINL